MIQPVALVLVAYHHTEAEINLVLAQWARQNQPPTQAYVVANSPLQSSLLPSTVRLLDPGKNIGFTGGVNLAARAAWEDGFRHVMLSNLDVELLSGEIVTKLTSLMAAHADCAFASPGIVMWPETSRIWYRGAYVLRPAWVAHHPGIGRRWQEPSRGAVLTGYFSGCCALVNLRRFLDLGGFEEELFMYYDEADVAERARSRGWASFLLDEPLVAHAKHDRSLSENEAYWHARNSTLLVRRHEHGVQRLVGQVAQAALAPIQMLRCDSSESRAAYLAGLQGRPQPTTKGAS